MREKVDSGERERGGKREWEVGILTFFFLIFLLLIPNNITTPIKGEQVVQRKIITFCLFKI